MINEQKTKRDNITFSASRCVVVQIDKNVEASAIPKKEDEIRRAVGTLTTGIIIEKIRRYSTTARKFMVQVSDDNMVEKLVASWNPSIFVSSFARKTISKSQTTIGVLKGVLLDIGEVAIKTRSDCRGQ